jgi:hypothetical protein
MYRQISVDELKNSSLAKANVLANAKDVMQRKHDLIAAMAYTNTEHDEVGIILQLASGEKVECVTDFLEYEEPLVELRGGVAVPVNCILSVEI